MPLAEEGLKSLKKLPDKVLHCLARIIQERDTDDNAKCLYCKYALECAEEFKSTNKILFMDIQRELEKCTSVRVNLSAGKESKDILQGSWAEQYPEVLERLTNKSFEGQLDILRNPDILRHVNSLGCKQ